MRDALAEALRKRGGTLDPADPKILDPANHRIDLPGEPPIRCGN